MKTFNWQERLPISKKALAIGSLAAVALVGSVVIFGVLRPAKPPIVVRLEPSDSDEITAHGTIKKVWAVDGTLIEMHTPYTDGSVGHRYFRADGTLRETTEYYPQRDAAEPVLKSRATWSADGKTIEVGEVFRTDGSLWFTDKNLGDDKREITYYFADGWKFYSKIVQPDEKVRTTTYFHRNGNRWVVEEKEKSQSGSYSEKHLTTYDATGQTRLFKTTQVGWQETVDGFKASSSGQLITHYNADGKRTHRQWGNTWWNSFLDAYGNLSQVHVFDTNTDTVVKTIEVDESGPVVKLKSVSRASGENKVFRDFGSMKKVSLEKLTIQGQLKERFFVQGTLTYEIDGAGVRTEHEDAEGIYETIDLGWLTRPPGDIEFKERRTQSQAESKGSLGARDDSDPVKWYHRQ